AGRRPRVPAVVRFGLMQEAGGLLPDQEQQPRAHADEARLGELAIGVGGGERPHLPADAPVAGAQEIDPAPVGNVRDCDEYRSIRQLDPGAYGVGAVEWGRLDPGAQFPGLPSVAGAVHVGPIVVARPRVRVALVQTARAAGAGAWVEGRPAPPPLD